MITHPPIWSTPPASVRPADHEIHIWRALLDRKPDEQAHLARTLSAEEWERAERFLFARDRHRYITRRGLLRTILAAYTDTAPHALQFWYGPYGKPALVQAQGMPTINFNMSDSQGLALYAITGDRQVGVDLEWHRPLTTDVERMLTSVCSEREMVSLRACPRWRWKEAFFICWARKEAYLKAIGEGLNRPPETVEVTLTPWETARLIAVDGNYQDTARWSYLEVAPVANYTSALVIEGYTEQLTCWAWPE